jgi:hypothetical protein
MDEIHKLFIGLIAVLLVFTIMFGAVAKIQSHNQATLVVSSDIATN